MMRQIMRMKLVHLMAFFILVYVGAEVTIGQHYLFRLDLRVKSDTAHPRWLDRDICSQQTWRRS